MAVKTVREWLERKRRTEWVLSIFSAVLGFAGGLFIVGITFGFLYLLVSFAGVVVFHGAPLSTRVSLVLCSLLVSLLFVESVRARRENLPGNFAAGFWVIRELFC